MCHTLNILIGLDSSVTPMSHSPCTTTVLSSLCISSFSAYSLLALTFPPRASCYGRWGASCPVLPKTCSKAMRAVRETKSAYLQGEAPWWKGRRCLVKRSASTEARSALVIVCTFVECRVECKRKHLVVKGFHESAPRLEFTKCCISRIGENANLIV